MNSKHRSRPHPHQTDQAQTASSPQLQFQGASEYPAEALGYLSTDQLFGALAGFARSRGRLETSPSTPVHRSHRRGSLEMVISEITSKAELDHESSLWARATAQALDLLIRRLTDYRHVIAPPLPSLPSDHRLCKNVHAFRHDWARIVREFGSPHRESGGAAPSADEAYTAYAIASYYVKSMRLPKQRVTPPAKRQTRFSLQKMDNTAVDPSEEGLPPLRLSLSDMLIHLSSLQGVPRHNHPYRGSSSERQSENGDSASPSRNNQEQAR